MIFLSAGAFDEVQLKQMSYALDMLCKKYGITDKDEDARRRDNLAKRVVRSAMKHGGHSAVVQALLDAGASLGSEDSAADVFLAAVQGGSADVVRLLLALGVSLQGKDSEGVPRSLMPLLLAAASGRSEVVQILKDAVENGGAREL